MHYVVTGAAGFLGSHLTEVLLAAGHTVCAIDNFADYYGRDIKSRNASGFPLLVIDLAATPLDGLLGQADGVFHLAGQPGVRGGWGADYARYVRDNILATALVFDTCARHSVRVVYASSSSVYGEAPSYPTAEHAPSVPISPYGVSKRSCELLAYAMSGAGLDSVGVRYFTVYGPRQRPDMAFARLLAACDTGPTFRLYGNGSASRSFTYVADAVSATVALMKHGRPGGVYNVGGGEEARMDEVVALVAEITGASPRIEQHPAARGDVLRTKADTAKLRADTGWKPETRLREGLTAQWRHHRGSSAASTIPGGGSDPLAAEAATSR
jgi:nucleoside-diphosphate-sugar epimerase